MGLAHAHSARRTLQSALGKGRIGHSTDVGAEGFFQSPQPRYQRGGRENAAEPLVAVGPLRGSRSLGSLSELSFTRIVTRSLRPFALRQWWRDRCRSFINIEV